MEDGKWKLEDGRWKTEDGRWKMEDGKWKMEDVPKAPKAPKARLRRIASRHDFVAFRGMTLSHAFGGRCLARRKFIEGEVDG